MRAAFELVQQVSDSAFTSAYVFTYVIVANRRPGRPQELLPFGDVVGVDLGQRAERLQVRQVDRPLGRQRVATLGHEPDAAEHDQPGVDVARRTASSKLSPTVSAIACTSGTW